MLNRLTSAATVWGTVCNMLHLRLTLQNTTLTLFFVLFFRHKWVRGHQRQGPVVSERSVQQHGGVLQVHMFSGLRGFCQTTQLHSGDPGVDTWENGKLSDRWAPPTSYRSPFSPEPGVGTKPPTVMLRRPNPHTQTHTRARTDTSSQTYAGVHMHRHTEEYKELCSECITWD